LKALVKALLQKQGVQVQTSTATVCIPLLLTEVLVLLVSYLLDACEMPAPRLGVEQWSKSAN
jgi:hypothetical protein